MHVKHFAKSQHDADRCLHSPNCPSSHTDSTAALACAVHISQVKEGALQGRSREIVPPFTTSDTMYGMAMQVTGVGQRKSGPEGNRRGRRKAPPAGCGAAPDPSQTPPPAALSGVNRVLASLSID